MRRIALFVIGVLLAAPASFAQDAYHLNPGDQVFIEVWNEEDMQREVVIMPDGNLSFPLAGQVRAAGLSAQQLQDGITEALSAYISSPVVTVSVTQMLGNTVYVIGQVNTPGVFVMNRPMTALQALSLSGGFTTFADTKRIKIIRGEPGNEQVFRVNYSELSAGDDLEHNRYLESGDVLIVP